MKFKKSFIPHIALAVILLILIGYIINQTQIENRQQAIRQKGSQVMPFDLDQTTHVFKPNDQGGVQQVIAKDLNNQEEIALIQSHLREEANRFSNGDFGDPSNLHGTNMPGLDVLARSQDKFTVIYTDLDNGGQITYLTDDQAIITAFHDWFMAQLQDHGTDAMEHM
jgi:hypothetical protein